MKPEWKRAQVWSEHDARRRRRRSLLAAAGSAFVAVLWIANYSCIELVFLDEPVRQPRSGLAPPVEHCTRDADCVVLPAIISCCGECPPAPPFEAALRSELADLRSDCTPGERLCDAPICGSVPAGCTATAVCTNGECRAVARGNCEGF